MLEPRILQTVTGVVSVFFILIYIVSILYLGHINNDQVFNNQRNQMKQAAEEISFWQVTTENLARRIALDEDLERRIFTKQEVSAAYSLNKRAIMNSLATYAHIEPGIQEITIYTVNGATFSSSEYRGNFVPADNSWYTDFQSSGEKSGFTSVHDSVPSQANITVPVITYILPFYDLSDYRQKLGDILISLEYDSLQRILPLNNDFLKGLCLYNREFKPLVRKGELSFEDERLLAGFYSKEAEPAGEKYILRSSAMQDDWKLVYELSDQVLRHQFIILSLYCSLIFGGLLLTLTVILRMLIRNIVRPVKMLTEAADQLGSGNFDVVVDIHTGDELEILSDVFNKMVGDMQTLLRESVENEEIKRKMLVLVLIIRCVNAEKSRYYY